MWKKGLLKKSLTLLMSASMLAASLTACSSSGSSNGGAGTVAGSAAESTDNTSSPDGGPVTVKVSNNQPLASLDRYAGFGIEQISLSLLWGDALLVSDHAGNYTNWLADDIAFSEDSLTADIKLKQGIKFQNGEELKASDVKTSFERIIKDETLTNGSKWGKYLDSVDVTDDYTCRFNFKNPMPIFYSEVCFVPIISGKAYEENPAGFFEKPVASGPFKVIAFDSINNEVTLERNDSWWGWDDSNKSNVDQISYKYVAEDTTRISSLRAGELDICENVPSDNIALLGQEGFSINEYIAYTFTFLGIGSGEGKTFHDPNLREALSLSIDRQMIVDSILGGGKIAKWPAADDQSVYEDQGYEYNMDKAKELVAASGYDGSELSMIVNTGEVLRGAEVAQAIQSMAAEAGLNVMIETLEAATYNERRAAGNYDICLGVNTMTNSEFFVSAIEINATDRFATGFTDEKMFELGKEGQGLVDMDKRVENAKAIYQIVMDNFAPNIYLYQIPGCVATDAGISNLTIYGDNTIDMRYMKKN